VARHTFRTADLMLDQDRAEEIGLEVAALTRDTWHTVPGRRLGAVLDDRRQGRDAIDQGVPAPTYVCVPSAMLDIEAVMQAPTWAEHVAATRKWELAVRFRAGFPVRDGPVEDRPPANNARSRTDAGRAWSDGRRG
jgi:hypothetical protein